MSPKRVTGSSDMPISEGLAQRRPCPVHANAQCPVEGQRTPARVSPPPACRQRWRDGGRSAWTKSLARRARRPALEPYCSAQVWGRVVRRTTEAALAAQAQRFTGGERVQPPRARLRGLGAEHPVGGGYPFIQTGEGWLYLCAVLDLFLHKILGWSMSSVQDRHMVLKAVMMACWRCPHRSPVILHTDRGTQFTSANYQ